MIEQKQNVASSTCAVVSEAARWLKAELKGAGVKFHYAACDERDHYGFAVFTVTRARGGSQMILEIKIAELGDRPYAFAQVRLVGRYDAALFPLFTELESEDGQRLLLHYLSDFILSATSTEE